MLFVSVQEKELMNNGCDVVMHELTIDKLQEWVWNIKAASSLSDHHIVFHAIFELIVPLFVGS